MTYDPTEAARQRDLAEQFAASVEGLFNRQSFILQDPDTEHDTDSTDEGN